jgi:hypothetical protein
MGTVTGCSLDDGHLKGPTSVQPVIFNMPVRGVKFIDFVDITQFQKHSVSKRCFRSDVLAVE